MTKEKLKRIKRKRSVEKTEEQDKCVMLTDEQLKQVVAGFYEKDQDANKFR